MARHPTDHNDDAPGLDQYPHLSEAMLDTVQLPLLVLNGVDDEPGPQSFL
jgi:hypothetical protein